MGACRALEYSLHQQKHALGICCNRSCESCHITARHCAKVRQALGARENLQSAWQCAQKQCWTLADLVHLGLTRAQQQAQHAPPTITPSHKPQSPCRHRTNRNMLLAKVMAKQPWADGPSVKSELDRQVDAVLGPKTEADERPLPKAKPAKKVQALWGWLACQR